MFDLELENKKKV